MAFPAVHVALSVVDASSVHTHAKSLRRQIGRPGSNLAAFEPCLRKTQKRQPAVGSPCRYLNPVVLSQI